MIQSLTSLALTDDISLLFHIYQSVNQSLLRQKAAHAETHNKVLRQEEKSCTKTNTNCKLNWQQWSKKRPEYGASRAIWHHPTQVNAPCLNPSARRYLVDLLTPEGWKAELNHRWLFVQYTAIV